MTVRIQKPGIFYGMLPDDYFADPCPMPSLTQSVAKVLLAQSAAHAKQEHPRLAPPTEDDEAEKYVKAQAIGNAAHKLLIGRGKDLQVCDFADWRKKEAQAAKEAAETTGKVPILSHHFTDAVQVEKAARTQLAACGWSDSFTDGNGEVVVCWQEDGIWLRTMIDWLSPCMRIATDFKTGGVSFAPHVIGRHAVDQGWDIQAAMHERALNAIDPDNAGRRQIRFAAIENYKPYALLPVAMSEVWLTMGRKKLDVAITIWRESMKTGRFDAYPLAPTTPEYPGYKETDWLNREVAFHEGRAREPMLTDLSGG